MKVKTTGRKNIKMKQKRRKKINKYKNSELISIITKNKI